MQYAAYPKAQLPQRAQLPQALGVSNGKRAEHARSRLCVKDPAAPNPKSFPEGKEMS